MLNKSGVRTDLYEIPFLRCRNLLRGPLQVVRMKQRFGQIKVDK